MTLIWCFLINLDQEFTLKKSDKKLYINIEVGWTAIDEVPPKM